VLHTKSAENDLPSKPKGLAGGSKDFIRMQQHRRLNKSLVKFVRFSTDC
jgi:hypothetical protein